MQVRFLTVDKTEAFLLGVKLKLSPTELKLLYEIAYSGGIGADKLLLLLKDGVSKGNIAVHISSINKKAEKISNRKLIIFEKSEYKINPFM